MRFIRYGWIVLIGLSLSALAACAGPAATVQAPTAAPVAPAVEPTSSPAPAAPAATATQAPQPTQPPVPTETSIPVLQVTGLVDSALGWSMAELKAMPSKSASGQNNKGETQSYTGVALVDLLKLAGPQAGAQSVVFLGEADTKLEVALADVQACANCIASFRSQGGLSLLLPFYSQQLALRGLREIQVK